MKTSAGKILSGESVSSGYTVTITSNRSGSAGTNQYMYYKINSDTCSESGDYDGWMEVGGTINGTTSFTDATKIAIYFCGSNHYLIGNINGVEATASGYGLHTFNITQNQTITLYYNFFCIEENEYIETPKGLKQIKDLQVGDYLIGVKENNKIIELEPSISNDCYKLTLSNNEQVIFTGSHLLLNQDLSIIRVCDLVIGQTLYNNIILENIEKLEGSYNVIRIDVDGDDTYLVRNGFYSHNK